MKWHTVTWLSFTLLFLFEGTLFPWIIPEAWHLHVNLTPHFVFVGVIYVAIILGRHQAMMFGLVFGLLQDVAFYGHLLGPHSFAMGLLGYLASLIVKRFHFHIFSMILIVFISSFTYELVIYSIYLLFQITTLPFEWVIVHQFIPTAILAVFVGLLLYVPARYQLENQWSIRSTRKSRKS